LKTLINILLLAGFALNLVGYHILFYARQLEIKEEMKQNIRSLSKVDEEKDFVIDRSDEEALAKMAWDGNDEFSLNGRMYDVIETRIDGRKIIIRALADDDETSLLSKWADYWKEGGKTGSAAAHLLLIMQTLFHEPLPEQLIFRKPLTHIYSVFSSP